MKVIHIGKEEATKHASKIDAYEHSFPKPKILKYDPEFPILGGKMYTNGNFIKWFGSKMHIG